MHQDNAAECPEPCMGNGQYKRSLFRNTLRQWWYDGGVWRKIVESVVSVIFGAQQPRYCPSGVRRKKRSAALIALLSSYLLHLLALLSKISWVSVDFGSVRPCRNTILPKNHQPIFLWSLFSFIVAVKMRDLCGAVSVRDAVENSKQLCEKKMSLKRTLGLETSKTVN